MDLEDIRQDVVGEGVVLQTSYGTKRCTYADHAASGRGFAPIEDRIRRSVLPFYANTHSETSAVAAQTSAFREEARRLIRDACGCSEDDAVIFTGSGMTGAIHTLIGCLGLAVPCCMKDQLGGALDQLIDPYRPVVFIGAFEHHSNSLPWAESICDVVVIDECGAGGIDLDDLRDKINQYPGRRLLGSFSAGSNVTGRLTNVRAVADVMHEAGGVAFFDYAAAGPYVPIDLTCCDAIFLSVHKFLGGPGAPGVLIAKRALFTNTVPAVPGGGTVSFVSNDRHTYSRDVEHREEGGTPNIIGSIRAGLAMQLKQQVGADVILQHEHDAAAQVIAAFRAEPNITVLGDLDEPRLGIVSFLVQHTDATSGQTRLLSHNFVVALLNDLFGIQARGGNSCAAPYAHRLLKLSDADEQALEACVAQGWHACKPGWTRVSFGWYDSPETIDFITKAVLFIAREGWRFLDDYTFDPTSGTWTNVAGRPPLLTLSSPVVEPETLPESVCPAYLDEAERLARGPHASVPFVPSPFEPLRWFWLPGELDQPSDAA